MLKKWQTNSEKNIGNFRIFQLNSAQRINPSNQKIGEFYCLKSPNWVNIMPITKDNKIVFVKQYRHGSDSITIELPAGIIEPNEEPIAAARRECVEETGYESNLSPEFLGTILPNPAFMNNNCYCYFWKDCERKFEQSLDEFEDIEVLLLSVEETKDKIKSGEINHSLAVCNLLKYFFEIENKSN